MIKHAMSRDETMTPVFDSWRVGFLVAISTAWNSLPSTVQTATSLSSFHQ